MYSNSMTNGANDESLQTQYHCGGGDAPTSSAPELSVVDPDTGSSSVGESLALPSEDYVALSSIVTWLSDRTQEVETAVRHLRQERPSRFVHPIRRFNYLKAVAKETGKRNILDQAAKDLLHQEKTK